MKSSSIPDIKIKPISTTHTKTKSISILTLESSDFRPVYIKQVSFDSSNENKVTLKQLIFALHKKTIQSRSPQQNQVKFDPYMQI